MTATIAFRVEGVAVGKPRPRVTRRGTFLPEAFTAWRKAVAEEAFVAAGELADRGEPWPADARAFRLRIVVVLADRRRRDVDNLAGGVMDALNGVLWLDDERVVDLRVRKSIAPSEAPHVRVEVSTLAEDALDLDLDEGGQRAA